MDAVSLFVSGLAHVAPSLVPVAAALGAVRAGTYVSPAISIAAFECRMASGDDRVDYSACIRDLAESRAIVLAQPETTGDDASPWHSVRIGLRRWAATCDQTCSPAVWIEIDGPTRERPDALDPFLVYTLPEISDDDRTDRTRKTRAVVAQLLELPEESPFLEGLAELTDRLPDWCAVRHVALRPAPSGQVLRAICRMPSSQAARFTAGGCNSAAGVAMAELHDEVLGHAIVTNVNFDVTPELGPRVGLEFTFHGDGGDDPRWDLLFDALERRGLLCREKRVALSRWPSPTAERGAPNAGSGSLVRDLLVKVDFDDRGPVQAKAYLPFATRKAIGALAARSVMSA